MGEKKDTKVFKDFAEYWHFVKPLPEYHRKLLVDSMSRSEQKSLKLSYDSGGWEDLFMRNACDDILAKIKKNTISPDIPDGIDLLQMRMKIIDGKTQLLHVNLWQHINKCFERVPWKHISYIFGGIKATEYDDEYIKLSKKV